MLQKKLIRNFIIYGKIKSTENRIRFLKTNIEKMINLAKKNTQASKNEIFEASLPKILLFKSTRCHFLSIDFISLCCVDFV